MPTIEIVAVHYAVIAQDGHTILQTGDCPSDVIAQQGGNLISVEAPDDVTDASHFWDGATFVAYPERPGSYHVFDFDSRSWTDPRDAAWYAAERDRLLGMLREERDARLTASDWSQLPDAPLSAEGLAAWRAYRQALRDLPENTADPANPDWPTPPTA